MIYEEPVTEDDLKPEHFVMDGSVVEFSGDHPKTGEVTITLKGPLCKVQDYGMMVLSLAKRYRDENPGKPCGCKDKK